MEDKHSSSWYITVIDTPNDLRDDTIPVFHGFICESRWKTTHVLSNEVSVFMRWVPNVVREETAGYE